jgi:transposase
MGFLKPLYLSQARWKARFDGSPFTLDGIFTSANGLPMALVPREYRHGRHSTVFRAWQENGVWEKINARLREKLRLASGRKRSPSAAYRSQSSKTQSGVV